VNSLSVPRWVLLRLATNPWVATGGAFLLGIIPLQQVLSPFPSPEGALELIRLWTPLAASLGALGAIAVLSGGEAFLTRLDMATRTRGEFASVIAGAAILILPIFLGALGAGARFADLARYGPAIFTSLLHLAAVALLLLHPAVPSVLRLALFVTLTWILPVLGGADALGFAIALFDAHGAVRSSLDGGLAASLAATGALLLARVLVRR
jgi:hypothetical protein